MLYLPLSRNCEKRLHLQPKNSGFIPSSRSPVGRGNREAHPKRSFLSLWPPDEEVTTVPAPGAWWSTMNLFSKKSESQSDSGPRNRDGLVTSKET